MRNEIGSLDKIGLSEVEIFEAIKNSRLGGASGRVAFVNSNKFGELAIKQGHSLQDYDAEREYAALAFLNFNFPGVAPKPHYLSKEKNILITERIRGTNPALADRRVVTLVASSLTKIHSIKFNGSGLLNVKKRDTFCPYDRIVQQANFLEGWFAQMNKYVLREDSVRAELLAQGSNRIIGDAKKYRDFFSEKGFTLTHYDLSLANMLLDKKDNLVLVDWGQPYIADPAMDIAKFFYKSDIPNEKRELFMQNYMSAHIGESSLRSRIESYAPLVRLGSFCWMTRILNEDIKRNSVSQWLNLDNLKQKREQDMDFIINYSEKCGVAI